MLLAPAERRLGIADRLARCFPDARNPSRITHTLADMIRARVFACGYEDADALDFLRSDPAFKLACGRLPETGRDLYSQPTLLQTFLPRSMPSTETCMIHPSGLSLRRSYNAGWRGGPFHKTEPNFFAPTSQNI
jgi:hypothetical protein